MSRQFDLVRELRACAAIIEGSVSATGKLQAANRAAALLRVAARELEPEAIESEALLICEKEMPERCFEDQPIDLQQRYREQARANLSA